MESSIETKKEYKYRGHIRTLVVVALHLHPSSRLIISSPHQLPSVLYSTQTFWSKSLLPLYQNEVLRRRPSFRRLSLCCRARHQRLSCAAQARSSWRRLWRLREIELLLWQEERGVRS